VIGQPPPTLPPPPPPPPSGAPVLTYPLRLEGALDPQISRWLWLVKWFLLIPHYIVLFFLSVAGFVLTIVAFFAILFTGRYPRGIFDFNVSVLRWWWRVSFYGYSALGTDRYPPFSFAADADGYPATLDVPYPERLSRGLVLVKWWLLAIPQYIIVAILAGGGRTIGVITLLVIVAGFMVLFAKRYPADLFDLIMGLNRWAYRVSVYVLLMRDEYPPFRLDMGGDERTTAASPPAPAPQGPLPYGRPFGI
jgi:hypothetical protein